MEIRRVNGRHPKGKKLFPVQLAAHEKALLTYLSTESGQPMGAIIRHLIFREASLRAMQPKATQSKVMEEPQEEDPV